MKQTIIAALALVLCCAIPATADAQGMELVWGYETGIVVPFYHTYSGVEAGVYPLLGLETYLSGSFALRIYAYIGGGLGTSFDQDFYWLTGYGSGVELTMGRLLLGVGYGMTDRKLEAAVGSSGFIRGTVG